MSITDLSLPRVIEERTSQMLDEMGRIKKPKKPSENFLVNVDRLTNEWRELSALARSVLADGTRTGTTYYEYRGAVWRSPEYRTFDSIAGWVRAQTPEAKKRRATYDKELSRLRAKGVWPRAVAHRRATRASWALVEALRWPDTYTSAERARLAHTLREAVKAMAQLGPYCWSCESADCEHAPKACQDPDQWVDRAHSTARILRIESGYFISRERARKDAPDQDLGDWDWDDEEMDEASGYVDRMATYLGCEPDESQYEPDEDEDQQEPDDDDDEAPVRVVCRLARAYSEDEEMPPRPQVWHRREPIPPDENPQQRRLREMEDAAELAYRTQRPRW